jgi:hypothetical protein
VMALHFEAILGAITIVSLGAGAGRTLVVE